MSNALVLIVTSFLFALSATNAQSLRRSSNGSQDYSSLRKHVARATVAQSDVPKFVCSKTAGSVDILIPGEIDISNSKLSTLCTLTEITNDSFLKPVARSYNGTDWETSAGDFVYMGIKCFSGVCRVSLPPLSLGSRYRLTTFLRPSYSRMDEIARFLEQATFGPTLQDIATFKAANLQLSFAKWIKTQQRSKGLTSHREYFRRRLNARTEVSTPMAAATHPCQAGTRYRLFAFSSKDLGKILTIQTVGKYSKLIIDGFVRTVVTAPVTAVTGGATIPDASYRVCNSGVGSRIGGAIFLEDSCLNCKAVNFNRQGGNPSIQFVGGDPPKTVLQFKKSNGLIEVVPIDEEYNPQGQPRVQQLLVTSQLSDPTCSSLPEPGNPSDLVFASYDGGMWIHDPRHELQLNTVDTPIPDGGASVVKKTANFGTPGLGTLCSNVVSTFLNQEKCVLSHSDNTCEAGSGIENPVSLIPLNATTIRLLYEESGGGKVGTLYLYAIDGLSVESDAAVIPPCSASARSRWIKVECSTSIVGATTQVQIGKLIANALQKETNPNILDVDMTRPSVCSVDDAFKVGFVIADSSGQCWRNVHPDHLDVYDFTPWTRSHPGNTFSRNPIREFAEKGSAILRFPSSHELSRWQSNKGKFRLVGRLDDQFDYYTIPSAFKTSAFNAGVGFIPKAMTQSNASNVMNTSSRVLVCGSPHEVSNDPQYGGSDSMGAFNTWVEYFKTTSDSELEKYRKMVWTNIAIEAPDQLRQRVAWALSQIFAVNPLTLLNGQKMTELFLSYYDIFVRNAFGNFRDILKEVAYSPVMAEMLTFLRSKSSAYEFDQEGTVKFADENFAREVMQLFTVGLYMLHPNGVKVIDNRNQSIQVYSNDDIVEYARVWTGFTNQPLRGNIEAHKRNRIDPMKVEDSWRDPFPKMGLNRRYVGDGYPLCADLPEKHFLSKGATYKLLGRSSRPLIHRDPETWEQDIKVQRLQLDPNGTDSLFAKLCGALSPDQCNFRNRVVLNDNIPCTARECVVDTVRTVEVTAGVFYEYYRPPCVYQAFHDNAKLVTPISLGKNLFCADPRTEIAITACCPDTKKNYWNVTYWGERVTFATAARRCNSKSLCSHVSRPTCLGVDAGSICSGNEKFWTNTNCSLSVKIDENGNIAILHKPEVTEGGWIAQRIGENASTFFRVDWSDVNAVKSIIANCTSVPGCSKTVDDMCVCPVSVSESQVFYYGDNPSRQEVLRSLPIGGFDPRAGSSSYTSQTLSEVSWYGTSGSLSMDSVFSVKDDAGMIQLRKNMKSTVTILGSILSFRNPVHFNSLEDPEPRDAYYETDAALDHYFYHSNTAPFIATRMAQRFGISNPSPGYIQRIATAFRTGLYLFSESSNVTFGSGKYGDLAATVACVLLDREARNIMLDADPMHGSLREPLLKVIGLMRSMQFKPSTGMPFIELNSGTSAAIGQMAYEIPSVFSYFLPGFKPSGVLGRAGLVAPEAQVSTSPRIINTLNGLLSLIKYGLDNCYAGLGSTHRQSCNPGHYSQSSGWLQYTPGSSSAVAIVNELAMLLTAGRLSSDSRETIQGVYLSETNKTLALIRAQSLIVSTPEFHSTSIIRRSGVNRPSITSPASSRKSYKAIVYVQLAGGVDSFNMLVPHTCTSKNEGGQTLLEQYNAERTSLAFTEDERSLIVNARLQPCEQFAVHPKLDIVAKLYQERELAFFANAGVLNAPVRMSNYTRVTRTILFDHNSMKTEAQKLDPFDRAPGSGILGRMCDKLREKGFNALPMNVEESSIATVGLPGKSVSPITASETGSGTFNPKPKTDSFDPLPHVLNLNGKFNLQSSLYGETWSSSLIQALYETDKIRADFSKIKLTESWVGKDYIQRMKTAAKLLISSAIRGTDRDAVFVTLPEWDHHELVKESLSEKFADLNTALTVFRKEMVAQGLWDNVVLVTTSDFGRTLTVNSGGGSDHGWGGNYFMMGGSVLGGQIHGQYPQDITEAGPVNFGRGRIAPTTSWESIMNGILEWMGIEDASGLDYCLPNRNKTGTKLFKKNDLFAI